MAYARPIISDGSLNRAIQPGDVLLGGEVIQPLTTVGAGTLTALLLASGLIYRTGPVGAFTDTTDTSANIINQIVAQYNYSTQSVSGLSSGNAVQNGTTVRVRYMNSVAFVGTIAAGTGVTLGNNATTVNASSVKDFLITVTNGTPQQVFACSTTNASAVVTGLSQFQTSQLTPGMLVTGTGIPASTTIASIQNGVGVTLSANATATNVLTALTFNPTIRLDGLGQGLL